MKLQYRAALAQCKAGLTVKTAKLARNDKLRACVRERLAGAIRDTRNKLLSGYSASKCLETDIIMASSQWADRCWSTNCDLQHISRRLTPDFSDDALMGVFHEAINQALCIKGRQSCAAIWNS